MRPKSQPFHSFNEPVEDQKFSPSVQKIKLSLGSGFVPVTILKFGDATDLVFINMHDNEFTSVEAAKELLSERGGLLIKIENNKQRFINFKHNKRTYSFDANRIFSLEGIKQSLRERGRYSDAAALKIGSFADNLLSLIPQTANCVIALHNNFDGGFSIKSYIKGGDKQKNAIQAVEHKHQDADDIAFTTDPYLFEKMSGMGYNSILQDNINARKDGSLSVYFGERGKRYINIETEHGRDRQYVEMLSSLFKVLFHEKIAKLTPGLPGIDEIQTPGEPVDN